MFRLLCSVVVYVVAVLGDPVVASEPSIKVFPNPSTYGEDVTVTGEGFCHAHPCSDVTLLLSGQQIQSGIKVDPGGAFRSKVQFREVPGTYSLEARQSGPDGGTISVSHGVQILTSDSNTYKASPSVEGSTPGTSPDVGASTSPSPINSSSDDPAASLNADRASKGQATKWWLASVAVAVIAAFLLWRKWVGESRNDME